jgi:hypothetical protein
MEKFMFLENKYIVVMLRLSKHDIKKIESHFECPSTGSGQALSVTF